MPREEELAIQVGVVDGIEVDHGDRIEASQDEVLHQLAADATGADDEDLLAANIGASHELRRVGSHSSRQEARKQGHKPV